MNKAIAKFNRLTTIYLDNNDSLFADFMDNFEDRNGNNCSIITAQRASESIHNDLNEAHNELSTADELDPFGKQIYKHYYELEKYTRSIDNYLSNFDNDSLVIYDSDNERARLLTIFDLKWIRSELDTYLENDAPIKFRIRWILKHKNISDYALGRKTDMSHVQINLFKRGKRDIGNMTLDNAIHIDHYYCDTIDNKLL